MASSPGPLSTATAVAAWAAANSLAPKQVTEQLWYRPTSIDGTRWNGLFPFEFIVVERQGDGTYSPRKEPGWRYSLPLPPESFRISNPFAITTTMTMGGSIDEYSGDPLRMISLSGSTGVLLARPTAQATPPITIGGLVNSIIAGTATVDLTAAIFSAAAGPALPPNIIAPAEFAPNGALANLTGYYQIRLLQYFLEAFVEFKRTLPGRTSRLAFAAWKRQEIYLVTPQSFDIDQSANSPLEYLYNISLKATKRIKLGTGPGSVVRSYQPIQRKTDALGLLLGTMIVVRQLVQDYNNNLAAINADTQAAIWEPARELMLFAKDALSVPLTLADLPDAIVRNCRDSVLTLKATGGALANFANNLTNTVSASLSKDASDANYLLGLLAAEQQDDPNVDPSRVAHPANDPFENPSQFYTLFSGINVGDLNLPPAVTVQVANERTRVRNLTRLNFQNRRDAVAQTSALYSAAVGLTSATYNETYGLNPPAAVDVTPSPNDLTVIGALNDLVIELSRMAVANTNDPQPRYDSLAQVAGLAQRSGIAFTQPRSKFGVPFPFGSTIEWLAQKYLGDPGRAIEIIALNGLQSPYVDEEGFILDLLVNGQENSVLVSDATYLFVGQPVWIASRGATRTQRRIVAIEHLSPNQHLITVDGDPDLDQYTVLADAQLQAYLPGTVNSQQVIYIPSQLTPTSDEDFVTVAIPGVDVHDKYLAVGGVDWLLTPKNDLALTPQGDVLWAQGLNNIVQTVRLAVSTVKGTLLGHPEYGLPISVGQSLADLDQGDLTASLNEMFGDDPTFAGITSVQATVNGPVVTLGMGLNIAGTTTPAVVPIGLDVVRQ